MSQSTEKWLDMVAQGPEKGSRHRGLKVLSPSLLPKSPKYAMMYLNVVTGSPEKEVDVVGQSPQTVVNIEAQKL